MAHYEGGNAVVPFETWSIVLWLVLYLPVKKLAVFVRAFEQSKGTQAPLLKLSRLSLDQSQPRNTAKLAQCFV